MYIFRYRHKPQKITQGFFANVAAALKTALMKYNEIKWNKIK